MPPPGGPLIGSGMKAMIAEAAIKADMEHRDWMSLSDGSFFKLWYGSGYEPDCYKITVRDGHVEVERYVSGYTASAADEVPQASDYTYLQADVFDYWRGAIDEVFVDWEDFPESSSLGYDLSYVLGGLGEIQLAATQDAASGGYQDGNSRLSSDIDNLFTRTADLSGVYAYEFNTRYASKIRPNVNGLHALSMVLAYALGGEEELFQRTREQIADTALKAKAAFEASSPKSGGGDTTGLVVALIVVGAVAAGVAAVASAGATVPATVAVVGGLVSAGAGASSDLIGALGSAPAPEPEPIPLQADTPQGVLTNLRQALRDLNTSIKAEENVLDQLLSTTFEEARGMGAFQIPGIANPDGGNVLTAQQNVSVNPQVIADIVHLWIPTIGHELRTCAGRLTVDNSAWLRPASIGIDDSGPYSSYASLQFQVSVLLHDTARELDEAGAILEEAARQIGLSDEQANAASTAIANNVNTENINY